MLTRSRLRGPIVAVALLAVVSSPAAGQVGFKEDPIDRSLRLAASVAKRYAKGQVNDAASAQRFRDYLQRYYLPAMTRSSPEALEDLGDLRFRLVRDFLDASSGDAESFLTQQAAAFAVRVIDDPTYHPAVRYNALLVLGRLDEPGAGQPKPLGGANTKLCQVAMQALKNASRPRYELAGALVGLERHAAFFAQLDPPQRSTTGATLLQVLRTDAAPGQYDDGVAGWVYLQAATAMANIGAATGNGRLAATLVPRIADKSLSLETRAAIAAQLARIPTQRGQFDAAPLADAILELAVDVVDREADFAERFEDLGGRRSRGMPASRDPFSTRITLDEQGEVELVLDGVVALLADLQAGMNAARAVAPEPQQSRLTAIADAIRAAARVAIDPSSVELVVTEAVSQLRRQVNEVANASDDRADDDDLPVLEGAAG